MESLPAIKRLIRRSKIQRRKGGNKPLPNAHRNHKNKASIDDTEHSINYNLFFYNLFSLVGLSVEIHRTRGTSAAVQRS